MLVFWMTAQPWDPVAGAAASVRATSCDLAPCVIMNGLEWLPVLAEGPTFSTSTFDGAAVGPVDATRGEVTFAAAFGEIDNWAGLVWSDRPIQIYYAAIDVTNPAAPVFPSWAELTKIFDGVVESYDPDRASLSLSSVLPAGKVASATYTGGGGASGAANIAGTVKPWASGRHLNRPAVLVDPAAQLYQVHGYGPIQELTAIREAGTVLDQARVNYATAALLIAASIPATTIGTCLAEGMFRLGFTPVGTISADFKGDNGGGTFSARPGVVIKRLLTATGWSTSKIAQDSLDDLDATVPYDIWCYDDSGADVLDLITEIVQPLGGYWDVDELGTFYVGLFRKKAGPDFSVGDPGLAVDYDLFSVDQLPTRAPFWRNRIGYAYNPNVYSPTELNIADSVASTAAAIPAGNANRVRFSQFEADTLGWALNWNPNGIAAGGPLTNNLPPFKYVRQTAMATAANQRYALGIASAYRIPVTAGERLSVQAKFAAIGAVASTTAYIFFVDTAGAAVGSGATIGSATGTRPYASGDWFNAATFVDVPTGAVLAYIEIHNISSGAGLMTADLTRVMVTEASAGQTVHPSFTPGPNAADGATVGADWATNVANIPYDDIISNADDVALGFNPSFEAWTGAYPDGWSVWSGSAAPTMETSIVRIGARSVRFTSAAGGNIGMMRQAAFTSAPLPVGTFLSGAFDLYYVARTSGASGILVRLYTNAALTTFVDNPFTAPATTVGAWQRVPWTARVGAGQRIYGFDIFVMASWDSFGAGLSNFVGTTLFDNLRFAFFDSTVDNTAIPFNQNRLPNSDQSAAVTWSAVAYNPNGATFANSGVPIFASATWGETDYALASRTTKNVYVDQTNRATGTADGSGDNAVAGDFGLQDGNGNFAWIPVEAGHDYIYSCYIANHRCAAAIAIIWADAAGTTISNSFSAQVGPTNANANSLALYQRASVRGTVPAGAVKARVIVRKFNTVSGQTQSYLWWAAPQLERVPASVSAPSPYVPGPPCTVTQLGYSGDLNATNGAPTGTSVGGTAAGTVAAGANAANNGVNSDGTIKGDKVVTDSIAARAATDAATATAGAGTLATGGTVDGVSVTYNVVAGKVRVDICADAYRSAGSGHIAYAQIIRTKGGVDTQLGRNFPVLGFTGDFNPTVYWVIDTPGAGAVTYKIRYTRDSGTGTLAYNNQQIAVTEFKDQI